MINERKLKNQIENLLSSNKNLDIKDFQIVLDMVKNTNSEEIHNVDLLVGKLFPSTYGQSLVPWDFFETELGKAILKLKGCEGNDIYFVKEVAKITGRSVQYINQEIKNGRLKGYKRGGTAVIYKSDLDLYIAKKKLDITYEVMSEEIITPEREMEEKYGE